MDQERLQKEPLILGHVLENFVILELLKQLSWSPLHIQLYHYRDYKQSDIDLVLEGPGGDLMAIEIKTSETVSPHDFKSMKAFQELVGSRFIQGILLYAGKASLPFGPQFTALPISSLWSYGE